MTELSSSRSLPRTRRVLFFQSRSLACASQTRSTKPSHAPSQHLAARPLLLGPDAPRRRPPVSQLPLISQRAPRTRIDTLATLAGHRAASCPTSPSPTGARRLLIPPDATLLLLPARATTSHTRAARLGYSLTLLDSAHRQNFYIVQGKALNTTIKLGAWGACTSYRVRHLGTTFTGRTNG